MPELLETLIAHNISKRESHRSQQAASSHTQSGGAGRRGEAQRELLLSLNAGSSSLKFKAFDRAKLAGAGRVASALVVAGSIKIKDDKAVLRVGNDDPEELPSTDLTNVETLHGLLDRIAAHGRITHVVHRIVHGASLPQCISLTRADASALDTLTFLSSFAPLHNAVSVSIIRTLLSPSTTTRLDEAAVHLCCFDTTFHHAMPPSSYRYLVDPQLAGKHLPGGMEMRKWGFHGISYSSILDSLSRHLGPSLGCRSRSRDEISVIICHLGSGSSICAVQRGKSLDTTMGLTPLEGLPGGTRSGSVDPVLALHISRAALSSSSASTASDGAKGQDPFSSVDLGQGIKVSQAELVLNKHSGFKAICGTSDFQQVVERRNQGDDDATVCFDVFVDKIVQTLGGYYFKMASTGVDSVVFSGGIGEASGDLHRELARRLESTPLHVAADADGATTNAERQDDDEGEVVRLDRRRLDLPADVEVNGKRAGGVPWLVVKTDEESEMAREVKSYMSW
ncbi:uncharacterized protein PFL1_02266 [Pseudozyma flocculosa PF-1]|uniref:Probable acetate kinase n=1 Tax=Pseudozyma flocculosa TaxID=84751 RepID=A0A5C3F5Y1_9BASI|nr:uncharacterized protein PFL1_02266 [Pseudozyma flocculosa PF-1]EPQ30149.1 hypothetical protein PFL1_02266 [Pseudozyma flocculosa PF-1]SPO39923.1 related to Acetate kinase [Pseudozyma flocculosa]